MPRHQKPKPELLIDEQRQRYVTRDAQIKRCTVINWPGYRNAEHVKHFTALMRLRGYIIHSLNDWQATRKTLTVSEAALVLGIKTNTVHWRISQGQLAIVPGTGKGKNNHYLIPVSAVTLEELQS